MSDTSAQITDPGACTPMRASIFSGSGAIRPSP